MANNVYTKLTVTGPADDIAAFEQAVKSDKSVLDESTLFPCPPELRKYQAPTRVVSEQEYEAAVAAAAADPKVAEWGLPMTAKMQVRYLCEYGAENWYDWCLQNWGSKWGFYQVKKSEKQGTYFYDTAWMPMTGWFLHVSQRWPNLSYEQKFADEGGGFVGMQTIQNGSIVQEESYDWDSPEGQAVRDEV